MPEALRHPPSPPERDRASARAAAAWQLLVIFAVALGVRLVHLAEVRDLPTFHTLVMDAARYDALARRVLDEGFRPRTAFYQAPLYPYLLAAAYALTGRSLLAVRLIQVLLGAVTAVLAALAAGRLAGDDAPSERRSFLVLAAGLLAAFYAPAIHYTPLLLKTVPALLCESAALLLLLPPAGRRLTSRRAMAAGLVLGAAALLQENLLLLIPVVAGYLLFTVPRPDPAPGSAGTARRSAAPVVAGALVLGAALALAPAALINFAASGSFLLTSSQGGVNFYIGNSRAATGIYTPLSPAGESPERQKADSEYLAALFAARDSGRPVAPRSLSPGQVSHLLVRETLRQIAADPRRWLGLTVRKLRLFWNDYEVPDAEGFRVYRRQSVLLTFDPVGFGLLAPLAAVGLVALWRPAGRSRRTAGLLAAGAAAACASVVLFFVFGRYRLGVVPFLLPLAAAGAAELLDLARRSAREPRRAALDLALLAAAGLAANLPVYTAAQMRIHDAATECNLGAAALVQAAADFNEFQRLAAGLPAGSGEVPLPTLQAGERLAAAFRQADGAVGYLTAAVSDNPDFTGARIGLADALCDRAACQLTIRQPGRAAADLTAARGQAATALAAAADPELRAMATAELNRATSQLAALASPPARRPSATADSPAVSPR